VATAEPCRVTIAGPRRRLDCALPTDVPLAAMLPSLLHRAGHEPGGGGTPSGGWVLQRLGDVPLDTSQTLTDLAVRTGEVLYLRPGERPLPAVSADDIADTLATAVQGLPGRWTGGHRRVTAFVAAVLAALGGAAVLAVAGPPWTVVVGPAAVAAVLLVGGGAALSRIAGDRAGAVVAALALPYSYVCGAALAGPARLVEAAAVLAGSAAVILAAAAGAVATGGYRPWFLAAGLSGACGQAGAVVTLATGGSGAGGAAVVTTAVLLLGHLVPSVAVRLGGAARGVPPVQPADIRAQPPAPSAHDVERAAARTDSYQVALFSVAAAVLAVAAVPLATVTGWAGLTLVGLAAAVYALRARHLTSAASRTALLAGAGVLSAVLAAATTGRLSTGGDLLLSAALLAGCGTAILVALRQPGSPRWGRAGDLLEGAAVVAAAPVALQVLGVYALARAISG